MDGAKRSEQGVKGIIFILLFLIVFFSNDTTLFGTNRNAAFVSLGFLTETGLLFAAIALNIFRHSFGNRRTGLLLLLLIASLGLTALFNRDFRRGYAVFGVMAALGFFMTQAVPPKEFARAFAAVFKFFSACSVIGKIVTDLFPAVRNAGFVVYRSTGQLFNHFLVYARTNESIGGERNFSIFREPGVFQIYLIIAILLCILLFDKKKTTRELAGIAVLVIALLMTKSTTGYMALILIGLFYLVREKPLQRSTEKAPVVAVELLAVLGLLALVCFNPFNGMLLALGNSLVEKFDPSSEQYISSITRTASFGANFKIWLRNPVLGVGISQKNLLYNDLVYTMYGYKVDSDTNTILASFSQFGLFVGALELLGIYGFSRTAGKSVLQSGIVAVIMLLLLSSEYLVYSANFHLLLWYGLSLSCPPSEDREEELRSYEGFG